MNKGYQTPGRSSASSTATLIQPLPGSLLWC